MGGETSLVDGRSIHKSHVRLKTYGTLDELNSHLGLLISLMKAEDILKKETTHLAGLQIWLFQLGSQLACVDKEISKTLPSISEDEIHSLEAQIDRWEAQLPSLKNFILPGGHKASAQAHICRTLTRRAERSCVELNQESPLDIPAIPFLNRTSDYFFCLARLINERLKIPAVEWKPQ